MKNQFRRGVEIGAGDSFSSDLLRRKDEFLSVDLYEPHRLLARDLREVVREMDGVRVHEKAVANSNRRERFYNLGYTSFLQSAASPSRLYCYTPLGDALDGISTFVDVLDIAGVESDDTDVLNMTCNGSEMMILNRMKMRPRIIELKYFAHNQPQKDYCKLIARWMEENGYKGKLVDAIHGRYYHMMFNLS